MRAAPVEDHLHLTDAEPGHLREGGDPVAAEQLVDLRTDAFDDGQVVGVLQVEAGCSRGADIDDEHGTLVRSLSAVLPGPVGSIIATVVVLVSLVFLVISLVTTWTGNADDFLPLFQVSVAGTIVSLNALYARRTFSYVITLIGAILTEAGRRVTAK